MRGYMKSLSCYLSIFFSITFCFSQSPDVFRAEYMLMPKNNLDIKTSRVKLLANVPIALKEDHIVLGGEYNWYNYDVPASLFSNSIDINNLHVIDVNLGYILKWNEDWRIVGLVTPRWASNFTNGVEKEDFSINYTAGVFKEKKDIAKPFKLVMGLSYNVSSPIRVPLPFLYYEKRFNPNWSYVLGVPKTGLKYYTKKKHYFQTELILDGYYVNIQNDILLQGNDVSTDVSSTAALITFGYQHKFTKDVSLYLMAGHTVFQSGVLRDINRNDIFTINDESGLYFRTGFRIGI